VFQAVPPSPEELASDTDERAIPPEPDPGRVSSASQGVVVPAGETGGTDAQPVAVTDAVRHEFDGGRLIAIEIEEAGVVTRLVRGDDGWDVHPG
jgi:hypothetical protein